MNSAMFGGLAGIIGEVVNNGIGLVDANLKNKEKMIESREKMHDGMSAIGRICIRRS